jgi:hypothetical protein
MTPPARLPVTFLAALAIVVASCGSRASRVDAQGNREAPPRDHALELLEAVTKAGPDAGTSTCVMTLLGYKDFDDEATRLLRENVRSTFLEGFAYGRTVGTVEFWFRTTTPDKRVLVEVVLDRNSRCKSFTVMTLVS